MSQRTPNYSAIGGEMKTMNKQNSCKQNDDFFQLKSDILWLEKIVLLQEKQYQKTNIIWGTISICTLLIGILIGYLQI